jgi:hypothetical protein
MSDTQPIDLNSAALGIGRDVSGIADLSNGRVDAFVRVDGHPHGEFGLGAPFLPTDP